MRDHSSDLAHAPRSVHIRPADRRWRPAHTKHRISTAIRKGTPDLDSPHRVTLLVFANALSDHNLRQFDTRVRLGAEEIAERIGAPLKTIRWHIQNLCSNGATGPYMVDVSSGEPGGREAYDLSPTLAKLPQMEARAGGLPWPGVARVFQ